MQGTGSGKFRPPAFNVASLPGGVAVIMVTSCCGHQTDRLLLPSFPSHGDRGEGIHFNSSAPRANKQVCSCCRNFRFNFVTSSSKSVTKLNGTDFLVQPITLDFKDRRCCFLSLSTRCDKWVPVIRKINLTKC